VAEFAIELFISREGSEHSEQGGELLSLFGLSTSTPPGVETSFSIPNETRLDKGEGLCKIS
jgi:hypothetical protein